MRCREKKKSRRVQEEDEGTVVPGKGSKRKKETWNEAKKEARERLEKYKSGLGVVLRAPKKRETLLLALGKQKDV